MSKKIEITETLLQDIIIMYKKNLSVVETAKSFSIGKNKTRKLLKDSGALLSISDHAKMRTGKNNPFFGKIHSEENKTKHSEFMKTRLGELNPNYRHGNYLRRPRDFKIAEFSRLRSVVFNRDNHTCQVTGVRGGHLHAHHLLPFWVCEEAFLDIENLITVSTEAHLNLCHNGDWAKFNANLVTDKLLQKYSIDRERLNEMADFHNKSDVIVRPLTINKISELDGNELAS